MTTPTPEQVEQWDNEAIELARDEILANPICAPFHALHQKHFATLAYAAGAAAERERIQRAMCVREWHMVNDPPCHPSDESWKPCRLCRVPGDSAIAEREAK